MFKFMLGLTVGISVILPACAQSKPVNMASIQKNESSQHSLERGTMEAVEKESPMSDMEAGEYWVKTYGSSIFNSQGKVTGSLRLIAKVNVFDTKNGMARIDAEKDQWVTLDILSKTKPENRITGPNNDNDLPRIKLPTSE